MLIVTSPDHRYKMHCSLATTSISSIAPSGGPADPAVMEIGANTFSIVAKFNSPTEKMQWEGEIEKLVLEAKSERANKRNLALRGKTLTNHKQTSLAHNVIKSAMEDLRTNRSRPDTKSQQI